MKTLTISEKKNAESEEKNVVKTFTDDSSSNIYLDAVKFLNSNYNLTLDINEDMLEMSFETLQLSDELAIPLEDENEKHLLISVTGI